MAQGKLLLSKQQKPVRGPCQERKRPEYMRQQKIPRRFKKELSLVQEGSCVEESD